MSNNLFYSNPMSTKNDKYTNVKLEFNAGDLPDIYYIILDMYGSNKTLLDYYNYNNHWFSDKLTEQSFYIADSSHANYIYTYLSVPSALNMEYLDNINIINENIVNDFKHNLKYAIDSKISKILDDAGYSIVLLDNFFGDREFKKKKSDIYLTQFGFLTPFQLEVYNISLISKLFDFFSVEKRKADHVINSFNQLASIPLIKEPTFTFAHIYSPHKPFIFKSDGEIYEPYKYPVDIFDVDVQNMYKSQYVNEIVYLNKQVLQLVDTLLAISTTKPIIILQGDHGPPINYHARDKNIRNMPDKNDILERTSIFNAYYYPNGGDSLLYKSITPVNSFRVLCDYYFGTSFGLINDRSYYSLGEFPDIYNWIEVTDSLEF